LLVLTASYRAALCRYRACLVNLNSAWAQLGLVLPQRTYEWISNDGFTVATIDLTGFTGGQTYAPHFGPNGYLDYALGVIDLETAVNKFSNGGGLGEAFGFPAATDYLANALPNLGKYFADLTTMLTSGHKH